MKEFPVIDQDFAFLMVNMIANISPRTPGTAESKRAITLLCNQSSKYADSVLRDTFSKATPIGNIEFTNVIAEIEGQDSSQYILIGSHFDTKQLPGIKIFQGANDGASSSGVLLAMMKAIKDSGQKPPVTLRFVFFDGEECFQEYTETDGLYGSKHYAQLLEEQDLLKACVAMVLLDMVGDKDLTFTIPLNTDPQLLTLTNEIAAQLNISDRITKFNGKMLDDFVPFQEKGIKCIDLIDFNYGPNNVYWHTSHDTMSKISKESLKISGDLALGILWQLD